MIENNAAKMKLIVCSMPLSTHKVGVGEVRTLRTWVMLGRGSDSADCSAEAFAPAWRLLLAPGRRAARAAGEEGGPAQHTMMLLLG